MMHGVGDGMDFRQKPVVSGMALGVPPTSGRGSLAGRLNGRLGSGGL